MNTLTSFSTITADVWERLSLECATAYHPQKRYKKPLEMVFPTGRLINYSFQQACVSTNKILGYGNIERCNFSGNTAGTPGCSLGGKRKTHMIESTAQAKYNDVRRVERNYTKGVHKARKEAHNGNSNSTRHL